MERIVNRIYIQNELDVMLAHKRGKQLAEITGLNFADQSKFAAAVSEISRNAVEHGEEGEIKFIIAESGIKFWLKAIVQDKGKGIEDINEALTKGPDKKGKGIGIVNAKKLVDQFEIESRYGHGTTVRLSMHIPPSHPPINESIINGWKEFFENEAVLSPYEMLKKQNFQLIDTLEQVKVKNIMIENQLEEIKRLNNQLEKNNGEISRLSSEMIQQNTQLKKKNNELDEFAYIVTHDLKAPLNNMLGLVTYMESEASGHESDFGMLKEQVNRMHELINNILSYAKSGRENVQRREVNVGALVKEIVKGLAVPANINIHISNELPVLFTEQIYLHQIFSNLISNAIKYHDKEHGNIWIEHGLTDSCCEFTVADDGAGIPEQKKEEIFNMFSTIRSKKSVDSTGMGLAIVKKIIESKGGSIKVEDNLGAGSKFIFTWPEAIVEKKDEATISI